MKIRIFLLLILPALLSAQQTYRSPYLADPSLIAGYVNSCAAFWAKAYDAQFGGYYSQTFNASHPPSGIYFYRMEAASLQNPGKTFTVTRKMLLVK